VRKEEDGKEAKNIENSSMARALYSFDIGICNTIPCAPTEELYSNLPSAPC
jgi:hypothetical protein